MNKNKLYNKLNLFLNISLFSFLILIIFLASYIIMISFKGYDFYYKLIEKYFIPLSFGEYQAFDISNFVPKDLIILRIYFSFLILICISLLVYLRKINKWLIYFFYNFISYFKYAFFKIKSFLNFKDISFILFLFFFIASIIIRLYFINLPIEFDEAFSFNRFASKPFYFIISDYTIPNNHVLHTILMRLSYLIFGNNLWSLRLPAIIFGILTILIVFIISIKLFDKHIGILSFAFIGFIPIFVDYSVCARGYTMVHFFSAMIFLLNFYILKNNNIIFWILNIIFSALGFYVMPIFIYPYAIIMAILILQILLSNNNFKILKLKYLIISVLITLFFVITFYLPIIVVSTIFTRDIVNNLGSFLITFLSIPKAIFSVYLDLNNGLSIITQIILILGLLIYIIYFRKINKKNNSKDMPLPLIIFLISTAIFILSRSKIINLYSRFWVFIFPFFIIYSSAGLVYIVNFLISKSNFSWINKKREIIITLIIVLLIVINFLPINYNKVLNNYELRDAKEIAIFTKTHLNKNDKLVDLHSDNQPMIYYFRKFSLPTNYLDYSNIYEAENIYVLVNLELRQTLSQVLNFYQLNLKNYKGPYLIQEFEVTKVYKYFK